MVKSEIIWRCSECDRPYGSETEALNKYHEVLPLIEKALDQVFKDTNLDVI
jgi:hypothetical protein